MGMVGGPDSEWLKANDGLGHCVHSHGVCSGQDEAQGAGISVGRARTLHGYDSVHDREGWPSYGKNVHQNLGELLWFWVLTVQSGA